MNAYQLHICCVTQVMKVYCHQSLIDTFIVSTGANGTGQLENSGKTPLGWHCIAEKYAQTALENSVFVGRKLTGEIYCPKMKRDFPTRDWILTRILRLKGLEPGFNLGEGVDTFERYIYIHGTPDETPLGKIGSKGCIRMRNKDIMKLYDYISLGTPVYISDEKK